MFHLIEVEDVTMSRPMLNRKPVKILVVLTLACIVLLPIISSFQMVSAQSQDQTAYYNREFIWDYGGNHWIWNLSIPVQLYAAYKAVPQPTRAQIGPENFGFFTTTQDTYVENLAQKLNQTGTKLGYSSYDEINFVLAFVQSIPYKTDNESTPYQVYPRFPVETLVDDVGDCKSHSVLFATLTLDMGFGTVYINPPDHLAVGVLGDNLDGTHWTYNGGDYYYCETTGVGFKIGQYPDQFMDQKANVYGIDLNRQYVPNLESITSIDPIPTISPYTSSPTTPTSTFQPNPTTSIVEGPTIQPAMPISLNLISEAPLLFAGIIVAVVICIFVAVRSTKTPKEKLLPEAGTSTQSNVTEQESEPISQENKFCIYCGASNKSFAAYCEKCGKPIN